jgi:ligand-binding sensor domain-containing protein
MALDDDRNLWVGNAGNTKVIQVLKNNGIWKAFSFLGLINNGSKCGQLLIDDNGYKWLTIFENIGGDEGLLVFNDNGTIDYLNDDESQIVDFGSNRVRCIEKDLDGTIWAGTDQGVYLFYPPNLTPQQILIKQDNSYQYLLATDPITTIAVDGANRKWVGTENSGLYLFSSDGQTQIQHFTATNSPLFSDNISALAINDITGEVFIGTDKGIISYQSDATPGKKSCGDLVVYPNPVRREYNGPIAVKGVVANGTFKVTDISGGLVYEGKSLGGQAVWDGRNIKGDMVTTGVYIIYAADATGENNCETKVMLYR